MTRRGFTLIELMMASGLSVIVMLAIFGMLLSVWTLAKGASDEMQGALRARVLREKLYYHLMTADDSAAGVVNVYGLVHATNVVVNSGEIIVHLQSDGPVRHVTLARNDTDSDTRALSEAIDWNSLSAEGSKPWHDTYKGIYLKVPGESMVYLDRLVVPAVARRTVAEAVSAATASEKIRGCFGE